MGRAHQTRANELIYLEVLAGTNQFAPVLFNAQARKWQDRVLALKVKGCKTTPYINTIEVFG
jgi:hypothetical protein